MTIAYMYFPYLNSFQIGKSNPNRQFLDHSVSANQIVLDVIDIKILM